MVYFESEDAVFFKDGCQESAFKKYKHNLRLRQIDREGVIKHLNYLIKHEAGHDYFFDAVKDVGSSPWLQGGGSDLLARHAISEGVAEYMAHYEGHAMMEGEKVESFEALSVSLRKYGGDYPYKIGPQVVTPILDEDFEKGIKALIENPLTGEDLDNPLKYREKIMNVIR